MSYEMEKAIEMGAPLSEILKLAGIDPDEWVWEDGEEQSSLFLLAGRARPTRPEKLYHRRPQFVNRQIAQNF